MAILVRKREFRRLLLRFKHGADIKSESLAEASGGRDLTSIEGVFQHKQNPVRTFWPLWQMLLVIVTGSLFADIAWRRLNVADWFRRRAPIGMPV